jgi:hypothetical protein
MQLVQLRVRLPMILTPTADSGLPSVVGSRRSKSWMYFSQAVLAVASIDKNYQLPTAGRGLSVTLGV